MKVKSVRKIHHELAVPVYDVVEVENNHNFLIAGENCTLVASNCDEINFSQAGVKDVNKAKQRMKDLYNTISARVKGTFRMNGEVYGKIFAVSSKRGDSDFMESYIQQQLEAGAGDHMYVSDAPQWEVLPSSMFSPGKFYIAVGDRHKKGFVVPDNQTFPEALDDLRNQGYKLLTPPIDMRPEFLADFDIALRDLAGISVIGALSFITQDAITRCINTERKNPFYNDILQIGTKDSYTIEEFFHIKEVPSEYKRMPMFIHLDLSITTDRTGVSGVCINGRKDITDNESGKLASFPTFGHVFSVALEAPRGDRIPYSKIVTFIKWLRDQGFNIAGISRDTFQSEYVGQMLTEMGFDVTVRSLDRTPDGYIALRSVLLEQRIDMLDVQLLQDEMVHLQRDANTGKIDHPVGGCFTGDTKVRLVDGRSLTILKLMQEQEYRTNWVYTINESTLKIEPKRIKSVHQTKITKELVRMTLDNGEVITCTPDHRFMLRDGTYEEAQNLFEGCSLMPLYTKISDKGLQGYRMYYEPLEDKWHYEHRKFCICEKLLKDHVIHHQNYNKLDNCPSNLKQLTRSQHEIIHNNNTHDYTKTSEGLKLWYKSIEGTDIEKARNTKCRESTITYYKQVGRYRQDSARKRIECIESIFGVCWDELSTSERNSYGGRYARYLDDSISKRCSEKLSKLHKEGKFLNAELAISDRIWYTNGKDNLYIKSYESPPEGFYRGRTLSKDNLQKMKDGRSNWTEEQWKEYKQKQRVNTSNRIWITNGSVDKYILKDSEIPGGFYRGRSKVGKNHQVISIEFIHFPCKVYDLTIEDNPNFALDSGVFVHNSKDTSDSFAGAIWNAILTNPPIPVPVKNVAKAMQNINLNMNRGRNTQLPSMFGQYNKFGGRK